MGSRAAHIPMMRPVGEPFISILFAQKHHLRLSLIQAKIVNVILGLPFKEFGQYKVGCFWQKFHKSSYPLVLNIHLF